MRKSLSFEGTLYVLTLILSVVFVGLIILSLATTPLRAKHHAQSTHSKERIEGRPTFILCSTGAHPL